MEQEKQQFIMAVSFDEDQKTYKVHINKGVSVEEVVFAVRIIARCLERDKIIENTADFESLLNRYLTDSQFEPLNDEGDDEGDDNGEQGLA